MLLNFFKTTFRSLWKNKGYSFLNIFGLAVGIACAGLIFLWVEDEVNFDDFHAKKDNLYYVRVNQKYDAGVFTHSSTPGVMAPAMQAEIPGIANTCRTSEGLTSLLFTIGDKPVYAAGTYAEPSLFSMFTLPFVQGNANSAFTQLHSVVITQATAKKFFGKEKDVVGKRVKLDNKQEYTVTGVLKDLPATSTLQFEWVAPFENWFQQSPWAHKWSNTSISTYVELKNGVSPAAIDKQLNNFIQQREPTSISHPFLFSIKDWHLYDEFANGEKTGGGRITYVRLFSIIAWIILLLACINFMNLATAYSERRAREVGVRKVLGAGKKNLVIRFIGEAILMSMLGALAAIIIMVLALPAFNLLVQKTLSLRLQTPLHATTLLLITLICGLVAGSYPSLYLSSFKPVFVLKGIKAKTSSATYIRKGLVVLQFTASIVLIISTVIIYQQIQHVKSRQLGFEKDNLMEIQVQGDIASHFSVIKQDLLNTGVVENAALSDHAIIYGGNNTDALSWKGKPAENKILISTRSITAEFFSTCNMEIIEGRNIQAGDSIDANAASINMNVVITSSLAQLMGKESAIGKTLFYDGNSSIKAVVVGVVKDYVYGNMYGKPDPVIFMPLPPQYASAMYIRMKPQASMEAALNKIGDVMKKNNPAYPFTYRFVDDQFNLMFMNEMLMGKLSRVFAALAIIISCLGLFGLAAYTAERRTKEIGIRKVLGATAAGLAGLLSKDFLQLVIVSCIVAFPLAWWAMNNWLQNYQYRTTIHWWVFVAAGAAALIVTLVTVSFQAIKAAMSNPVKSLRTE